MWKFAVHKHYNFYFIFLYTQYNILYNAEIDTCLHKQCLVHENRRLMLNEKHNVLF